MVKSDQTPSLWLSLVKSDKTPSYDSDLTRESHKLGVWSDLTMESINWVFCQTWPWRVITGCLVRLDHGLLLSMVKSDKTPSLLLSMVKSDQTPSYYSPWSSLTKHPVITLHGQVWPNTQLMTVWSDLTMESNKLGVLSDLTRESNKLGVLSDLTMESNNWMFGQTWPWRVITTPSLWLSLVKSDKTPNLLFSWVFGQTWPWIVITGCFVKLDLGE
jgi:hypothetical protein